MLRTTSANGPAGEGFGAGRFHCGEAVHQHRREDLDHLAVAVELSPNFGDGLKDQAAA
jgi:hypothetical protein